MVHGFDGICGGYRRIRNGFMKSVPFYESPLLSFVLVFMAGSFLH